MGDAATAAPGPVAGHGGKILDIERLRGVAILLVLMAHFSLAFHLCRLAGLKMHRVPFQLGVELFFVISGFVVTASFLAKQMSFRAFYVRRVFRLWPVLAVMLALNAGTNWLVHHEVTSLKTEYHHDWRAMRKEVPAVFLGYVTLRGGPSGYYTGPLWSLSVEEQFYMAAPLVLFGLAVTFRRNSAAASKWAMLGVFAGIAVVLRFGFAFGPRFGLPGFQEMPAWLRYVAYFRFDFLALGVLLFFLKDTVGRLNRLPFRARQALMLACILGPMVVGYKLGNGAVGIAGFPGSAPWQVSVAWLSAALMFGVAVALASAGDDLLRLGRPLNWLLLYLGSRSYSIYVLHSAVMILAWLPVYKWAEWLFYVNPLKYAVVHLVLTWVMLAPLVEVVYRWVEQPTIRLGGRLAAWLTAPKQTAPAVLPLPAGVEAPRRAA